MLLCNRGTELEKLEHSFFIKVNYLKETLTEDYIEKVWKYNHINWQKKTEKDWEKVWKKNETQERVVEMLDRFNNNILAVA